MAAVTVNSKKYNVDGSLRQQLYNISGGDTDTLIVGLFNVNSVNIAEVDSTVSTNIPTYKVANQTPSTGFCTITFKAAGAYTNIPIEVLGN